MATIGFIGLGNMGSHMARNLIKAGHELKVFDLNEETVRYVAQSGAKAAATAAEAAANVQFVVTMLPVGANVRAVPAYRGRYATSLSPNESHPCRASLRAARTSIFILAMSTPVGHSRRHALHDTHNFIASATASDDSASGPSCPEIASRSVFALPRVTSRSFRVTR